MTAEWAAEFHAAECITEVLMRLKSGKEATVYLCKGGKTVTTPLVAAKVYHERAGRGFQNRAAYQNGRTYEGTRVSRAVANKTRFGRRVEEACWVDHEFDVLCSLHAAGADVPQPLAASGNVILMEYFGSEEAPAPRLREVGPQPDQARRMFERLMWNVERFLANHIVHADLSPFNILLAEGAAKIIDFPQAADARVNANAEAFLARDVACLCRYFARFGVGLDAYGLSSRLWQRYRAAEL